MRRHPAEANSASPATGTLPHILEVMGSIRQSSTGAMFLTRGARPPWQQLGGQLAVLVLREGLLLPKLASGRLRMLRMRSRCSPAVPTLAEQGFARSVMRE